MGFFSSLIDGAKSAGGWVLDHAGDIASAVSTVAKVANNFTSLKDNRGPDHITHLEEFQKNLKIASTELQYTAKNLALDINSRRAKTTNSNDSDANCDSVTGVWKDPAPLNINGEPSVPMYQDLSKWLASMGAPADAIDETTTTVA
ncbi:hypothetical protein PG996_012603 [Apiospora saccharicola]|uniref:Uncharacterized protein n=1 Tax=Apiospora saccharicola TaxID=335842 RepID=A0ABR1U3N3_9PEZI